MAVAEAAGTPWVVNPVYKALGKLAERPEMIKVKKIPMDSTIAEF